MPENIRASRGRPRAPDPGSVPRGHRAIRMDGLSRCVRQTKDTYKRRCRTVVSTPPMGGVRTRDGNMPALKEISFEYARQIASVKGLQPGKVKGTGTLSFTKDDIGMRQRAPSSESVLMPIYG